MKWQKLRKLSHLTNGGLGALSSVTWLPASLATLLTPCLHSPFHLGICFHKWHWQQISFLTMSLSNIIIELCWEKKIPWECFLFLFLEVCTSQVWVLHPALDRIHGWTHLSLGFSCASVRTKRSHNPYWTDSETSENSYLVWSPV